MEDKKEYINYGKVSEDAAAEETKKAEEVQKIVPPSKPKDESKPKAVQPYTVVVAVAKLNVRKGPGKKAPVVSVLSKGTTVKIIAEKETADGATWGKMEDQGWINLEFVKRK